MLLKFLRKPSTGNKFHEINDQGFIIEYDLLDIFTETLKNNIRHPSKINLLALLNKLFIIA